MKKLIILCLFALIFTACSGKWDQSNPEMTDEQRSSHEEILEESLAALEEDPESRTVLFEIAFRYQQLGDWKEAVEYYEKVLEVNATDWAALNNLAYMYETMEDYEQASFYIKKLYESDPGSMEVIKDTVRILLLDEDSLNAVSALENFARLKLDSENPDPDMQIFVSNLYEEIYQWNLQNEQAAN